jgi:hypothetical protein
MGLLVSEAPNDDEITSPSWKNWFKNIRERLLRRIFQIEVPLAGGTVDIQERVDKLCLKPAGVLATLTINMPTNPEDSQIVNIVSTQNVTAVTHNVSSGQTINGALTAITASTPRAWIFRKKDSTWYREI